MILHASHNLVIQSVFEQLTTDKGATVFLTGEFGVGLALVYGAMAFWCWKRRAA